MTVETVALPDLGEGVAEGELLEWLVAVGEAVTEDQVLAQMETDKAVVDLPSPYAGRVIERHAEAGDMVPIGDPVLSIEVDDGPQETDEAADSDDTRSALPDGRVLAPPSVRRLARELGVDLGRVSGTGPNGRLTDADVRAANEGEERTTNEGDEPQTADGSRGETTARPTPRTLAPDATEVMRPRSDTEGRTHRESASAVDAASAVKTTVDAGADDHISDDSGLDDPDIDDSTADDSVSNDRTAPQTAPANAAVPQTTHTDHVDVTDLVELTADLDPYAADAGVDLTPLPFVLRAVARALAEVPKLNATLEDGEIITHDDYDLGVVTATGGGLAVPVVENVDERDLLDLASATAAALDGASPAAETTRATFTVTNTGAVGGEYATPVVRPPQVATLALGRVAARPWVVDDDVVVRHTLPLSLSVDHRVVDGATAARFTNRVREALSDPDRLLAPAAEEQLR